MGIPQVAGGRYPAAAPRHAPASIPNYSAGIDKIAQGVGTVNEAEEAYRNLVQKKAAAIQARQIADAKQLEAERSSGVREKETERAHKADELRYKRAADQKRDDATEEQRKHTAAGAEISAGMAANPKMSTTQLQNLIISSQAKQGIKPGRPMNPPSSTTFNIRSGQEKEQAKAQIPPLKAELNKLNDELEEAKATVPTRSKFKKVQDPSMPFMTKDSLIEVPDERDQRAIIKFITNKIERVMGDYRNAHSKSGIPFPVEETYPTAPEIDSLNPAGLNLPTR